VRVRVCVRVRVRVFLYHLLFISLCVLQLVGGGGGNECYKGPSSDSSEPLQVKYQKAINVHMSGFTKKTVVLTIFFIKEANYITGSFFL